MGRKRKWLVGGFGVLLVLAITASVVVTRMLDAPSVGVIHSPSRSTNNTDKPTYRIITSGKYASYRVANDLRSSPSEAAKLPVLERQSFVRANLPVGQLNIAIISLPSGDLHAESSYNYRLSQPALYKPMTFVADGQPVIVITNVSADHFEKTAYLQHGGLVAIVTMSVGSTANDSHAQQSYDATLHSWHWQ